MVSGRLIVLTAGKPYEPDPLLSKEQSQEGGACSNAHASSGRVNSSYFFSSAGQLTSTVIEGSAVVVATVIRKRFPSGDTS